MLCPACLALAGCPICLTLYAGLDLPNRSPVDGDTDGSEGVDEPTPSNAADDG